jgi:hypothetical protein
LSDEVVFSAGAWEDKAVRFGVAIIVQYGSRSRLSGLAGDWENGS